MFVSSNLFASKFTYCTLQALIPHSLKGRESWNDRMGLLVPPSLFSSTFSLLVRTLKTIYLVQSSI